MVKDEKRNGGWDGELEVFPLRPLRFARLKLVFSSPHLPRRYSWVKTSRKCQSSHAEEILPCFCVFVCEEDPLFYGSGPDKLEPWAPLGDHVFEYPPA